jgi:hypothetical protein
MSQAEHARLEQLWYAYPDVQVQRERAGSLWVTQTLSDEFERVMTIHPLYTEEHAAGIATEPYEEIEVRTLHTDYTKRHYGRPEAEIVLKPTGENEVVVDVATNDPQYQDPAVINTILAKSRQGLEMLDALQAIPRDGISRMRYNERVYDEMEPSRLASDAQALQAQGLLPGNALAREAQRMGFPREQAAWHAYKLLRRMPTEFAVKPLDYPNA